MLLLFTSNLVVSGFIMIGFSAVASPIADVSYNLIISQAFGISTTIVTFAVMAYFLIYVPINFLSNWVIDNYGPAPAVRLSFNFPQLRIAAVLTLVGAWFRILYNIVDDHNFTYIFLG